MKFLVYKNRARLTNVGMRYRNVHGGCGGVPPGALVWRRERAPVICSLFTVQSADRVRRVTSCRLLGVSSDKVIVIVPEMVTQSATILERHLLLAGEPPPPLHHSDFHKLASVLSKRKVLSKEVTRANCDFGL